MAAPSQQEKYLVTVDGETRRIVQVLKLGDAGELSEVKTWNVAFEIPVEASDKEERRRKSYIKPIGKIPKPNT